MKNIVVKMEESGNKNIMLCERGSTFGYNKKLKNVSPASTTYQVAKFNEMDIEE